ncbi:hypothetical protein Tdes44962_MAKER02117 [Teratosphaeria destructans]|uniref:Uncharacterized protein n=1 Tax=Teratosphaeria destructans TaxID=418781 RepID=A0A9W7SVF3_9PEZI|nr:hypothetical protein Tdes44962_MAKER02117 [Teratosphaeria destructans]
MQHRRHNPRLIKRPIRRARAPTPPNPENTTANLNGPCTASPVSATTNDSGNPIPPSRASNARRRPGSNNDASIPAAAPPLREPQRAIEGPFVPQDVGEAPESLFQALVDGGSGGVVAAAHQAWASRVGSRRCGAVG